MRLERIREAMRRETDAFLGRFLPQGTELEYPPVFLIGPPRAGTTLLYQLMVRTFRFAYINNLTAQLPRGGPVLARLAGCRRWSPPDSLHSSYGRTDRWSGPSEGGRFWHVAIPPGQHHQKARGDLDQEQVAFLRRSISAMIKAYGAPFVSKNVLHSVRVELLDWVFPGSLFIVCRRDPVANAGSILVGRKRSLGEKSGLWSVCPKALLDKADVPVPEHVAWQIILTHEAIQSSREKLGGARFLDVHYEDLCRQPSRQLDTIDEFLKRGGLEVTVRNRPGTLSLEPSNGPSLSVADEEVIRSMLERHLI